MINRMVLVALIFALKTPQLLAQERDSLQTDTTTLTTPPIPNLIRKLPKNILAIKGTVLPYFVGNDMGIGTSLGVEYIFFKRHSIGIDGFMHWGFGSHDNLKDTAGVFYDVGSYHHLTEKAVFLSYRFYINAKALSAPIGVAFYISPYYRYGNKEEHNDPKFNVEFVVQKTRSESAGILLGLVGGIDKTQRGKVDFNIGPFKKQKEITTLYLENHVERTGFEKKDVIGLRVGIFFTYLIY